MLAAALLAAGASPVSGQAELAKLSPKDGASYDQFGRAVAVSGNYLVASNGLGAVYVFDLTTGEELFKLTASDAGENDQFGTAVAASGTRAVVGASNRSDGGLGRSGAAYVFDLTTGAELFKLTASDAESGDRLGWSVAVSDTHVVVGCPYDGAVGDRNGSAYVFDLATGDELFRLTATDSAVGGTGDYFGTSVAVSGNIAVMGGPNDDRTGRADCGSAYVFDLATGARLFQLVAGDGATRDEFGRSVAAGGGRVVVGSHQDDDSGDRSGSAYLFDLATGDELLKLTASDGAATDFFGRSVAIGGGHVLVGSDSDADAGLYTGSAYVFDPATGDELFKLTASDAGSYRFFGTSVAAGDGRALVGSPGDGSHDGAVYVYELPSGGGPEPAPLRIEPGGSGVMLRFMAVAGFIHTVEESTDLDAWSELVPGFEGDGSEREFSFERTASDRFYRVVVSEAP